jgi:hypothetical protein
MPKYIIERELAGAGKSTQQQLRDISIQSNSVLAGIGKGIQWRESYVTDDKIYCIYISPNEALIREHAKACGIPANRISKVAAVIDPAAAE